MNDTRLIKLSVRGILLALLAIIAVACTAQATPVLVKDIWPGGSSFPRGLTNVNGTLFFAANDGANGRELWKSDGTEDGTVMVKDIDPRPWVQNAKNPGYMEVGSSRPGKLTNVNGTLFFLAEDGIHARSLWKSDGTEDGTVLVKEIGLWKTAAFGEQLIDLNGTLLFVAGDQEHEVELWKSDGTEGGTVLVKDIFPGDDAGPTALTNVNGTLFFRASSGRTPSGSSTAELWKSDGTEDGTVLVKDVPAYHLANVNGTLFFTASQQGGSLWKSDGTEGGTVLVKDMNARSLLFNLNDTLFFQGTRRRELWKSDGTEDGTVMVKDIKAGGGIAINGTLFFSAFESTYRTELWKSDGTEGGTVLVKDIDQRPWQPQRPGDREIGSSRPGSLTNSDGTLFFLAEDGIHGRSLWKSDGTEDGTVLVKDRPSVTTSARELTDVNGTLFFEDGRKLWKMER